MALGISFEDGSKLLQLDGQVSIDCGFPIRQAELWLEKNVVLVLVNRESGHGGRWLRVFDFLGRLMGEWGPPDGLVFGYLTRYPGVDFSIVCGGAAGSTEYGDWHYGIDLRKGHLYRIGPAR